MVGSGAVARCMWLLLELLCWVVAAMPDDMKAEFSANGFSMELVICVLTIGLLVFLLFLWRGFRSIQS
ncbi:hypothetical protein LEMLEM_LOCUS15446 [Lemmus lemmus]